MRDYYLSLREKESFYFEKSRLQRQEFPANTLYRVSANTEILIYTYDRDENLEILNIFLVLEPRLTDLGGVTIPLLDKQNYKTTIISTVPKKLRGYDIVFQVPVSCRVERTIKSLTSGRYLNGVTVDLTCRQEYSAIDKVPGSHYAVPLYRAPTVFENGELEAAFASLED